MKEFDTSGLLKYLEGDQKKRSIKILEADEDACMIYNDKLTRQLILNGNTAQLCEDCIKI